jgi:hypothetical protein
MLVCSISGMILSFLQFMFLQSVELVISFFPVWRTIDAAYLDCSTYQSFKVVGDVSGLTKLI